MTTPTLHLALPCSKCKAKPTEPCVNLQLNDGTPAIRPHTKRTPSAPCGTTGGYQRHKKAGESACDSCREANRRSMADRRRKKPADRQRDIDSLRARREAIRLLVQRHEAEFRALMAEIKAGAA